jgi:hypothetical protein
MTATKAPKDTWRKILRAAFEESYKNGFQGGAVLRETGRRDPEVYRRQIDVTGRLDGNTLAVETIGKPGTGRTI